MIGRKAAIIRYAGTMLEQLSQGIGSTHDQAIERELTSRDEL
jgi:hypothetical protein